MLIPESTTVIPDCNCCDVFSTGFSVTAPDNTVFELVGLFHLLAQHMESKLLLPFDGLAIL